MKTLVFSFDGTGNEPSQANEFKQDESITNVLKLHVMMGGCMEAGRSAVKTGSGNGQNTYYYNGIGTREGRFSVPLVGRVRSWINMAMAPTFGDARRILNEAEDDFEASGYEKGDRLVVFGFSRGAALARKFLAVAGYRPAALRGLRYRLFDEDEPEPPVLEGIADLRDAAEAWRAARDRRAGPARRVRRKPARKP